MGHEVVGTVVEKGPGVTGLAAGDRVILERYLPCCSTKEINPPCGPCRQGNYTLCENFSEGALPPNLGAGFSEHFLAHKTQLVKVPKDISDDQAVLVEPTAVSLHAVLSRPPKKGEKVLVIGAGTIGLGVIQIAKALGPDFTLHALEKIPFKMKLAKKYGADKILEGDPYEAMAKATGARLYRGPLGNNTTLGGFDLIYDCVGYSATIHDSLRWLAAKGDYIMIGNQLSPVSFDQTPIWQQELTLKGINAHGAETYQGKKTSSFALALELISKKKVNINGLITHRFPFADYKEAFKLAKEKSGDVIKVVLKIS
jgi:2-desacetyl-2-hydroxyethyl bacteriochlorophyllide A dehydrogenase